MKSVVETKEGQSATAEKIVLFEIDPIGRPTYSDDEKHVIGYEGGDPSYEAVPETKVDEFLESYAEGSQYRVKVICNDLPMPFAAAPELLAACKDAQTALRLSEAAPKLLAIIEAAISKAEGKTSVSTAPAGRPGNVCQPLRA